MFLFGGIKTDRKLAHHHGSQGDYDRIQNGWIEACGNQKVILPKKALAEFTKRLQLSASEDDKANKAKLNFSKCGLDDKMVILLVDVLHVKPVISKLDLSGNSVAEEGSLAILRLLLSQAKQVRETPPEERMNAVYLQDINLERNKGQIRDNDMVDIQAVTAALAHINVKTLFRKSLLRNSPLTHDNVPKVWQEVSGERMEKQKLADYIAKFKLAPVALEILLIKDLVANKILQALTPKQNTLITYTPRKSISKSMSAGSKQSVYGTSMDEKDGDLLGCGSPLSKRASINFSNDEASRNSNFSDLKARVSSFYEMPLTKATSKSAAIDKEAKYESSLGSFSQVAVPPMVRKPSNMVALDRRKQYATSTNNSDLSVDENGRPLSTASSCVSMNMSTHSRRPSKMGKKSSLDLLDDEASSNFNTVYAESEGRSKRSSGLSLKAASQLALEGSPNIISLPFPSPVPAFISPTPATVQKSSTSSMRAAKSQSQQPLSSTIKNSSSTSGIQGSRSHEIKARRNSGGTGWGHVPPNEVYLPTSADYAPPVKISSRRNSSGSRGKGPEFEVYMPTSHEDLMALKIASRRNSYSNPLPVWPLPESSSKESLRRNSAMGLSDFASTESIEEAVDGDRVTDDKTSLKPNASEKLDLLLAFPLSAHNSAPASHSSEHIAASRLALQSTDFVESIETLSTKSSLSSYVMQEVTKEHLGAEVEVLKDVTQHDSNAAVPAAATTAAAVTAAVGGAAALAVAAATQLTGSPASLKSKNVLEEVREREDDAVPAITVADLIGDASLSTSEQQQHSSATPTNVLLNQTKSSSLLMEVDTDSPPAFSPAMLLPVRSPTQAFLMGSFDGDDDDDESFSNEIETPVGALEAHFYDDDEESNMDFLSMPSISPIQSPANRSPMHVVPPAAGMNTAPLTSDLSRSLDLSDVQTADDSSMRDGSMSETSSYFKDFMSPSVASTLPSEMGNTPGPKKDVVGWDSPHPSGLSTSPSPSVDPSATAQSLTHGGSQGRASQLPYGKNAKGQCTTDSYISLLGESPALSVDDNHLRKQTSSHSLSNGSDDNLEDSLVCSEMESEVPMSPEWFEAASMMSSAKSRKSEAPMSPEWFEASTLVGAAAGEKKSMAPMSPEWFEAEASAMLNSAKGKNMEEPMSPEWFEADALLGVAAVPAAKEESEVTIPIPSVVTAAAAAVTKTDASLPLPAADAAALVAAVAAAGVATAGAAVVVAGGMPPIEIPSKRPSLKCVVLFTPSPHPQQLPTQGLCSPPTFGDGPSKTTSLESILGDKLAPFATGSALVSPKSPSESPAQSYSPPQTAGKSSRIPVFDGKSWKVARSTDVSPVRSPPQEPLGSKSPHVYDAPLRKSVMEPLPAASTELSSSQSQRIYSLPLRRVGASSTDVSPTNTPPGDVSGNNAVARKGVTGEALMTDADAAHRGVNKASSASYNSAGIPPEVSGLLSLRGDVPHLATYGPSDTESSDLTVPVTKHLLQDTEGYQAAEGKEVDTTFLTNPAVASANRPPRPADGLKILTSPKAIADMIPHPENPELLKPPTPVGNSWESDVASDGTTEGGAVQHKATTAAAAAAAAQQGTGGAAGTGAGVAQVVAGTVAGTAAVAAVGSQMGSIASSGSPAFNTSPLVDRLLTGTPAKSQPGVTHHFHADQSHYDVDEEDDEEDESSTVTTIVSKDDLEFLNKSANKSTEGGLPGRRGVTRDTPVRNAANPMSLNDLSSPTPTESDLDYAGYDMGGQDQTDQQEGVIDCSAPFFADDNPMKATLPQRKNSFIEFGGDLGIKLRVEQRGGYKPRSASRDETDWHSKHSEDDDDDDVLSYNESSSHSVANNSNHDYDLYEREREKERMREQAEKELKAVSDLSPKSSGELDKNGMRRKNFTKVESVEELLGPSDMSSDIDLDLEDDLLSVSQGTSRHVSPLRNTITPPRAITPLRKSPPRSLTPPVVASSHPSKIPVPGMSSAVEFPGNSPESFSGANPLARQFHAPSDVSQPTRSAGAGAGAMGLGVAAVGLGAVGLGAAAATTAAAVSEPSKAAESNPMRVSKLTKQAHKEEGQKVGGGSSPPIVSTVFPEGSPSKAPPISLPFPNVSGDTAMTNSKSPEKGKSRPTSMTRSATNVAPVFSSSRPGSMSNRPTSISKPGSVSSRGGSVSSRPTSVSSKQGPITGRASGMSRPISMSSKRSAAAATAAATTRTAPVTARPQSMAVMRPLSVSTLRPTPVSPSARPLSISSRTSSISNATRHYPSSASSSRPVSMNLSGPWTNSNSPSYAPVKQAVFSPLTASTREKKEMMDRLSMLTSSPKSVPYKSRSPKTSSPSTPVSKGPRIRPVRDPLTPSSTICKTEDQPREREDSPLMWLTVLDLTERNLDSFSPVCYSLYPKHNFESLRVLILRDNRIIDLMSLELAKLGNLTDLDLAFNRLSGAIPRGVFPQSLERLDLSGNDITDVCNLSYYTNLLVLNVSNNCLKDIAVYPCNLTELDISLNLISNVIDLRILALSPSIKVLHIVGNPVVDNSKQCKVTVCSVLPRLVMLDDMIIPSRNARLKNGSYSTQSSKDKSTVAAMTKRGQERADLARCRTHSMRLREIEEERERKSRLIDDRARWAVQEQRSVEKHKQHSDYTLSDDNMSCGHSQSNASRGSNRRGSYNPGTPGKGSNYSAFGGTRYPTQSRKETLKAYQTLHVYSAPPIRRDPASMATHQRKYKTAVSKVNKWLLDSIQELGRASMVLGLAFWITEQSSLGADSQSSFSDAMFRIPFLKSGNDDSNVKDKCSFTLVDTYLDDIAAAVNCGVGDSEIQHSLEMAVESSKENMLAFQSVLGDIEEAIMRAHEINSGRSDVVICLRREIEDIMFSPKGQQLNDQVLAPFGCELVWETSKENRDTVPPTPAGRILRSPSTPWNPKLDYSGVPVSSHGYRDDPDESQEPMDLTGAMDGIADEGEDCFSDNTPHSDEFPSYNPSPQARHESASTALHFKHGMSQSGDSIPSSKENSGPPSTIRSISDYPPYDFNDNLEEFSGEDE